MLKAKKLCVVVLLMSCCVMMGGLATGCSKEKGDTSTTETDVKLAVPAKGQQVESERAEARLRQSFKEATREDPPEQQFLPNLTKTNKSVGKLYETVVAEWNKVQLLSSDGKKLTYATTITTDLGVVTIDLWPEVAPNHVKNFIALSRAGYYDGLAFDRAIKQDQGNGKFFECLEGGCPVGTGDVNFGSIGYWLKPEINPTVTHEPGTVDWHGEDMESAACKFYINLGKAEGMDGSYTLFGKVSKGLDVLRTIHAKPVREEGLRDRPVEPVLIRSVTISGGVKG